MNEDNNKFLATLKMDVINVNKLDQDTREQADSQEWMKERKPRFTASNFGRIRKRQRNHDKFVEELLNQKRFTTAATKHGKEHESVALKCYETYVRRLQKPVKVLKSWADPLYILTVTN